MGTFLWDWLTCEVLTLAAKTRNAGQAWKRLPEREWHLVYLLWGFCLVLVFWGMICIRHVSWTHYIVEGGLDLLCAKITDADLQPANALVRMIPMASRVLCEHPLTSLLPSPSVSWHTSQFPQSEHFLLCLTSFSLFSNTLETVTISVWNMCAEKHLLCQEVDEK